jgi:hypothetical protein
MLFEIFCIICKGCPINSVKAELPKKQNLHLTRKLPSEFLSDLKISCERILKLPPCNGTIFNPWQFAQKYVNEGAHPQAIIDVLNTLPGYWDSIKTNPWQYTKGSIRSRSQNYNEQAYIQQANEFKKFMCTPEISAQLKTIMNGIGQPWR